MHYQPTKIEQLDLQFAGLADDVRRWLLQGITSARISRLLFEKYQVSISPRMVGRFQSDRWVPERRLMRATGILKLRRATCPCPRMARMAMAQQLTPLSGTTNGGANTNVAPYSR
jgi:hypothetical protein